MPAAVRCADDPVGDRQPQAGARPASVARWKRSKIRSRSSGGMPGPASSTSRRTRLASPPTETRTVLPSGANLQALSTRTPEAGPANPAGSPRHGAPGLGRHDRQTAGLGHDAEPLRRGRRHDADVDGLRIGCPSHGVEAGQPQQVLQESPDPVGFAVNSLERAPVGLGIAFARQRQACLGLDHGDRRPQLVRGVSAEGQLALPRPLDRGRDAPPDDHRPQEDEDQQDRPDDQLGEEEGLLAWSRAPRSAGRRSRGSRRRQLPRRARPRRRR